MMLSWRLLGKAATLLEVCRTAWAARAFSNADHSLLLKACTHSSPYPYHKDFSEQQNQTC